MDLPHHAIPFLQLKVSSQQTCEDGQRQGYLIEVKHLLLVGALVVVGLRVSATKLQSSQVVGQCGLFLSVKPSQVDLLALLPNMGFIPASPGGQIMSLCQPVAFRQPQRISKTLSAF